MTAPRRTRMTIPKLRSIQEGIVCVTAYDYLFAKIADQSGVDLILVGDSLAQVYQGRESTIPVSLDEMVYHTSCVSRAVKSALVVADMPFLSYEVSPVEAVRAAGRLLKEGGAHAVKLEGGVEYAETIAAIVRAKIPVMGHIGLMPQAFLTMGGYKVQGKQNAEQNAGQLTAAKILEDAVAVEKAGAFSVVVEGVPSAVGAKVSSSLIIPTIGIGAGPHCTGQILVTHDLLGLTERAPKFVKQYGHFRENISQAISSYAREVRQGEFPTEQYEYNDE
jgi:3-methyl-2-oxobutanoate hydroxymethyltransferase